MFDTCCKLLDNLMALGHERTELRCRRHLMPWCFRLHFAGEAIQQMGEG